VEAYDEINTQFEDLQVLADFAKEDPDSEKELDTAFPQLVEKIEDLEFKNMLSNEGDELSASDYSWSRWYGKLRLGFHADENVHHVGGKARL
jgi:hypothetical protein